MKIFSNPKNFFSNPLTLLIVLGVLFIGYIFVPRIFTGYDLAFQITAACLCAVITIIGTYLVFKAQNEQEEKKDKNLKIYENKLKVYSKFISTMWKTLEDEEVKLEELITLRSEIYNELIFYISDENKKELQQKINTFTEEKNKSNSNSGALVGAYTDLYSTITAILKADLEEMKFTDKDDNEIQALWSSLTNLTNLHTEEYVAVNDEQDNFYQPELSEKPTTFNGQFWHFNVLGNEQLEALNNGINELSLIEYNDEKWRTNLVRQVKEGDIVFLFKRGGAGYIGVYRVLGYRIMNFKKDKYYEEVYSNGNIETKKPIPDLDIEKYDFYKSKNDDADLCSNIIVEKLAYYDKGVQYPGGVYRRTISRYDYGYGKILLSRFLTKSKGGLEVSSYFDTLVDELNIKPAELDLNGHWK